MKLIIPHTSRLRPEVEALGFDLGADFIDVSGSDMAYGELVAKLWQQGQTFLLLEHDVLATPALLEEMWNCPAPWCSAFAWRYTSPLMPGEDRPRHPIREKETALFLNKFSADLLRRTPNVVGAVRVRWTQVDLALWPMLKQAGGEPHLHGPVIHLRQQNPAWAMEMSEADWADA